MTLYQVSEIELFYKRKVKISETPKISKSEEAYRILIDQWDENKVDFVEQAKILLLNRANRVIGISNISTGGISGTYVDPRLIFVTALKANASSIILAHNHPSGSLAPSTADKAITKRMMDAGKLLDLELLDHLIVTSDGFYSFAEEIAYQKTQRFENIYYEAMMPF